MADVIKIKKGLDIKLKGKPEPRLIDAGKSDVYSFSPDDYAGLTPKVTVKAGDKVKAGTVLMTDKNNPEVGFVSSVSGEVLSVNRGERRKVLSIEVKSDGKSDSELFGAKNPESMSGEEIKQTLLTAGLWPFIKQRPYDVIANPGVAPRDIFVSTFDTAPLAPDFGFVLKGEEKNFETGLTALSKMTTGKLYVGVNEGSSISVPKNVVVKTFTGKHPAGNVGTQIHFTAPVNKGEAVWTIQAADVLFIGRLFNKGVVDLTRTLAIAGSEVVKPSYTKALVGASMDSIVGGNVVMGKALRYISGNVLTGANVGKNGFLTAYATQVTIIPEGTEIHEFLGWGMPGFGKYSASRLFLSGFLAKKEYTIDARIKGGERAMIMSGEYDKVFPMDIYPEFLLKAIITFDIDKMENLGIYEVAPEDFALCEFVDTSKIQLQHIVREGLNKLMKEMN